jgi:hypothetical protein
MLMLVDATNTGPNLKNLPRANDAQGLQACHLQWFAPDDWPKQQSAIIERILDRNLDSLNATKSALESGALKLVRTGRR